MTSYTKTEIPYLPSQLHGVDSFLVDTRLNDVVVHKTWTLFSRVSF